MFSKTSFFFLGVILFPLFVKASDPVVEIDKIVITDRISETQSNQPVTTIPSTTLPIRASAPRVESAADVIQKAAGVHINRYGGLDEATSVSIRGSSASQVNVFLDGVPLETASGEGVGLSQIASATLSKIEVYKGLVPSEFGGSAIGGVVNLESKPIEQGWSKRFGLGFGSFFTMDALAEVTKGGNKNDWVSGVGFRRTKGDFTFYDNNGTPLNTADDAYTTRQNNDHQTIHPYIKWQHRFSDQTRIALVNHLFRTDAGVPGLATFQSQTADKSLTENLVSLKFSKDHFFSDKLGFTDQAYFRFVKSQFSDPNAEIGLGQAQDNDNRTTVLGNRVVWDWRPKERLVFKEGIEVIGESFYPRDWVAANPYGSKSYRYQLNLFAEPHVYLFERRLLLSARGQNLNAFYNINNNDPSLAAAGTYFSDRTETQFVGMAALDYLLVNNWHLKLNGGREVRLPKFVELFGDQGTVLGNAQLGSEKSFKFDTGVLWTRPAKGVLKKLTFESHYFETRTTDLIQFEVASGYARASNIGKARIRGWETAINAKLGSLFSFNGAYTLQSAKDLAVNIGSNLVGRPTHEIDVGVGFNKAAFSVDAQVNYIDNQFLDSLNTQRVDNRLIMGLGAGYLIKEHFRLGLEARNLTNSQVVDAVGFPLPGRSFFARVDWVE